MVDPVYFIYPKPNISIFHFPLFKISNLWVVLQELSEYIKRLVAILRCSIKFIQNSSKFVNTDDEPKYLYLGACPRIENLQIGKQGL